MAHILTKSCYNSPYTIGPYGSLLGCVKKSEPQNLIFYLWFPIVLGPQDSEFVFQKNLGYRLPTPFLR